MAGAPLGEASLERLHTALLVARRWPTAQIVFSGGRGRDEPTGSGARMREEALALGLAPERIEVEEAARDTRGNALHCAALIGARGWTRVAVVTSARHMARSRAALQRAGVSSLAVPTPSPEVVRFGPGDWLPDALALRDSTAALHEWIGMAYYRLRGWI